MHFDIYCIYYSYSYTYIYIMEYIQHSYFGFYTCTTEELLLLLLLIFLLLFCFFCDSETNFELKLNQKLSL